MSIKYYVVRYLYTMSYTELGYEITIALFFFIHKYQLHPDQGYIDNGCVNSCISDY